MIIFENEDIIIINKDNGVPSQMGQGLSLEKKSQVAIDVMLGSYCKDGKLVHRLDRNTSGLMVLAKNKDMAALITQMFREREIYKAYYALLCGIPKIPKGIIRQSSESSEDIWEIEGLDNKRKTIKSSQLTSESKEILDMTSTFEVLSVS